MTTVINFNLLNFFRPVLDQYGFKDARPDTHLSEEKRDPSSGRNRIIDVTQSSSVVYDEDSSAYSHDVRQAQLAVPARIITESYDRKGRSIQFVSHKGLNVDSYV